MKFNSIEPFVPAGSDFKSSKRLFLEIGFNIRWETDDYIGFRRDTCAFILQNFNDKTFAENLMIRVVVENLDEFWQEISDKNLDKKFNIKLKPPTKFPYGREVHLIDIAGVCWHFS